MFFWKITLTAFVMMDSLASGVCNVQNTYMKHSVVATIGSRTSALLSVSKQLHSPSHNILYRIPPQQLFSLRSLGKS